jgi:hypothetical protein
MMLNAFPLTDQKVQVSSSTCNITYSDEGFTILSKEGQYCDPIFVPWSTLSRFLKNPANVEHLPEDDIVRMTSDWLIGELIE